MDLQTAKQQLLELQAKMAAFGHASALIFYDGSTTAPKGTGPNRARTLSILSAESYKLATGQDTLDLLNWLDEHRAELDATEQRMVTLLLKDIRDMQKIPMDEYVAYQQLVSEADDVWHRAKDADDFEMFRPYLEQIFETNIRFAGYCAPDKAPYDHWLNKFEEGLSMEICDRFFDTLRSRIVPMLKKITAQPQVDDSILRGHFSAAKQEELACWLMNLIGLDRDHCGLSTTEHPFTIAIGSHHDVRITTHYHEDNFAPSLFSVVHEGGHALYNTGVADELAYTVLDDGASISLHESQSRFYENLLGRSRPFIYTVFPKLQELYPEQMAGHTAEELYKAINKVEPSLIRIEADEVTYSLHIMVRYELEKQVMAGQLAVKDLPAAWNKLYKEYLGVDVPDDRRGVLQDTHWSGGSIGYFPSYALGSAYGAHLIQKMKRDVDVTACLESGNFAPINDWNREHIWKYGSLLEPNALLEQALGEKFDPMAYISYLEEKYADIYGL